jgi:ParB-like chromosome segregation protein Spo0J
MTCPPCTHDCDQGDTCPIRVKERERIIAANAPELEKANAHIKRLEEHAYDLIGQLRVANIKLSMRPQRTLVGLTDEDCEEVERWVEFKEEGSGRVPIGKLVRYIEAKLMGKNT